MNCLRRLVVLVMVFILFAAYAVPVQAQGDPVTVRLTMHGFPWREEIDRSIIAQFMAENPDIVVEYRVQSVDSYEVNIPRLFSNGEGPDLVNLNGSDLARLFGWGVIAPVDLEAAGFENLDAVYGAYDDSVGKSLISAAVFDGQLYGLPTEVSNCACWANDDLFAAAGLDPEEDFPETWEEMVIVAEKFTARNDSGRITERGFDFLWQRSQMIYVQIEPMVRQLGSQFIDPETYTATIDTPEFARVLEYLNDWVNVYNLGGPQYSYSQNAFFRGNMAIDCSLGSWAVDLLEDFKIENYSIHPYPQWEDAVQESGSGMYGYYLQVNAAASPEVQAAAWKLAGYLTSFPEEYSAAGLFQPRNELMESVTYKENPVVPLFYDMMQTGSFAPPVVGAVEVSEVLKNAVGRVVTKHEAIDVVLADAQQQIDTILQESLQKVSRN